MRTELIKKAQGLDEKAQGELYHLYEFLLLKIVRGFAQRLSSPEEIDDLRQEASLAFIDALKTFDLSYSVDFSVYLRTIVRNRLLNYIRMKHDCETYTGDITEVSEESSELYHDSAFIDMAIQKMETVIGSLSQLEKKVLTGYLDRKSYREIADSLGIARKGVDNAIQRIKNKIVDFLDESDLLVILHIPDLKSRLVDIIARPETAIHRERLY